MNTNKLRAAVNELNAVIHTSNLYRGHSRFINAQAKHGLLAVENLQTGEVVPFVNDGSFRNGFGNPVVLSRLLK